jgi:EamA-like transporter family
LTRVKCVRSRWADPRPHRRRGGRHPAALRWQWRRYLRGNLAAVRLRRGSRRDGPAPGSILAFTAYGHALARLPVTTVSTYAYVNPVVAVLAGIAVPGEHVSWPECLGAALVVGSVVVTLHRSRSAVQSGHGTAGSPPDARVLSRAGS